MTFMDVFVEDVFYQHYISRQFVHACLFCKTVHFTTRPQVFTKTFLCMFMHDKRMLYRYSLVYDTNAQERKCGPSKHFVLQVVSFT